MDGHFATAVNVHFPPKLTSTPFAAFDTLGSMLPFAAVVPDVRTRPIPANHAITLNNYVPTKFPQHGV